MYPVQYYWSGTVGSFADRKEDVNLQYYHYVDQRIKILNEK